MTVDGFLLYIFLTVFWFIILHEFLPSNVFIIMVAITLLNLSLLLMAVRPFKSSLAHYNLLNAVFIQLLALFCIAFLGISLLDL